MNSILWLGAICLSFLFPNQYISDIIPVNQQECLIVTAESGVFHCQDLEFPKLIEKTEQYFCKTALLFPDDYFVQTMGSGLITISGQQFNRRGFSQCGPRNQYGTSLAAFQGSVLVGFSDGLYRFNSSGDLTPIEYFRSGAEGYVQDIAVGESCAYIATLKDIYCLQDNQVEVLNFPDKISHHRHLLLINDSLMVGTDRGLWLYADHRWKLTADFDNILSLYADSKFIYLGCFNQLVILNRENFFFFDSYSTYPVTSIAQYGNHILWGTPLGISVDTIPELIPGTVEFDSTFQIPHGLIENPFLPPYSTLPDQTYLFGTTYGQRYRVHKGDDYNNPEFTPIYAGAEGVVTSSGTGSHQANYITLNYGNLYRNWKVRGVYVHLTRPSALVSGDQVRCGQIIGYVGHTGRATNDHLHLEIRLTLDGSDYGSVNPSLWIESPEGTGMIAGKISFQGTYQQSFKIYGVYKPWVQETPFLYAEPYGEGVKSDPEWGENFAITGVLPGYYFLRIYQQNDPVDSFWVRVRENGVTWIEKSY